MKFIDLYKKPGQLKNFTKGELQAMDELLDEKQKITELKENHISEMRELLWHCGKVAILVDRIKNPLSQNNAPIAEVEQRQKSIELDLFGIALDHLL